MKKIFLMAASLLTLMATAQTKKVDVSKSSITWVGKKVTGKHEGTINIKEGTLVFKKDALKGGKFMVDMTSINTTDIQGEYKTKLDGHLKNDDFFGVEKFPVATLEFKKIAKKGNVYSITADLTIKGITKPVKFDLIVDKNTATTTFKIDRTLYGIKYGSGSFFDDLGDKTIDNEFELTVNLSF